MILIPSVAGASALYHHLDDAGTADPGQGILAVPVEAWDDTGAAYVAGLNKLTPATTFRPNRLAFLRLAGQHSTTGFGLVEDKGD